MNDEEKKQMKNFGALSYTHEMIEKVTGKKLEWTKEEEKAYRDGVAYAQYQLDMKLFEMAISGDIKALDKLEMRKKTYKEGLSLG